MSGNPRVITADTTITWDGASQRLARGTVMDVPPGGALEEAIGRERLATLSGRPLAPVAAAVVPAPGPEPDTEAAPKPKARAAAKADGPAEESGAEDKAVKEGTP